jgi:DNA polymerase III sliding clamp (beta) subunit (PCNA family)
MKKDTITEEKAKQTPAGGVLVGKREGQTIIHDKGTQGGYFVGKLHKEGGIQGINKSTGQPIEVQGGEVIITAPAVADQTKREFDGEMLTNREILSKINQKGGGVSLENGGEIYYTGSSYNYGGKTMTDYEIMQAMNGCGCDDEYENGGLSKGKSVEDIAIMHDVTISHVNSQLKKGIKVEMEHTTNKKLAEKIAKDHLVENPNYYTILKKVGLENGGQLNLMSESKKGDHTSRDLNNYNDLMDVGVDGQVGAETGLFVDGGLIAPNGNKTNLTSEQYKLVRTPEFKAWFGDWENDPENASKIVDENGEPLVVYHGTKNEFYEFDTNKQLKGWLGKGFYFSKNKTEAKDYGKRLLKCFLNIKNPFVIQGDIVNNDGTVTWGVGREGEIKMKYDSVNPDDISSTLKEFGNDGIIEGDMLSCFYPSQIKLADGTNTTFSTMNQDIRYDTGGDLKPYDANMDGDSADTMYKEGGGVDVVIEDGWKVTRYNDGKEIYKKEDKNYSHEILRNKRGEVQLSTIVLDSLHGESFNKTYSETIFEYFDSVDDAKKYVKENYDTMDSKTEKKEVQTLSAEVFEWDKVPTNYRNISKVKKVPFTNNPIDKGLDSIVTPFLGKDDLKRKFMGINFDENGITATDGHILITLPYPNDKYNGIYDITGAKKQKSKDLLLINENYPNYSAVIPKSENAGTPYEVDVYKLLQYTKTALNYSNKIYKGVTYKFGDNEAIGLNGNYFPNFLNALLKLGHEKVYAFISYPTRALVFSPNKNYELGNDDILLIMPIVLNSTYSVVEYGYGAEDKDTNRSLRAYYDFNDNEIHNADGSVAEFKMQYENNLSVDDDYLALLSKMTSKKVYLPILQYVKVEGGKMTATDLEISLIVKDVNMPNGIYEIVNKAPNITMNPIEDFPSERVFDKGEYETHWKEKRETAFEFVTFSEVFEFYLDKLLLSVGKDDLRPVMSGICIKKTAQNEMFLVSTNAHTLCKINITEYCEFNKDSRELEYILPVKYLKDFVKLADGSLHFKCSMSNIFIEADNLDFIGRTIDGKYPNYDAVIPRDSTKKIVFDHVVMNKCLKSPEMTNLIAKYKGRKDILFDFFNIGDTLNIKVSERKSYNVQSDLIETIELCKIDLNYKEVENTLSLDQSAFLLMPSKDTFKENQYFSFRKEFFDVMLETITDTEVDCYFSEPNRPYVFPIDAIDYKKTLPVEKTKQQKLSKKDLEQIVELEDMKEVLESNELQEAIETLEMLIGSAKGKDKKDIKEALEIIKMLNENN